MALFFAVALALAELEDHELFATAMGHDFDVDGCALDDRGADFRRIALAYEQDIFDVELGADFAVEFFDPEHVAGFDPVLFAAGADNRLLLVTHVMHELLDDAPAQAGAFKLATAARNNAGLGGAWILWNCERPSSGELGF